LRVDEFSGSSGSQSLPIHDGGDVLILCEGNLQGYYHSHYQVCFGLIQTDAAFGQSSLCGIPSTITPTRSLKVKTWIEGLGN